MATIRSYTTIEQSKVLAEFLPLESADIYYCYGMDIYTKEWGNDIVPTIIDESNQIDIGDVACWSLAALLEILDYPQLSKDKLGSGRVGWMVSIYPDNCIYDSCWHDNPVDACYEMMLKLHELKAL